MDQITQKQEALEMPSYTLGLDIGNASVGAALLGEDKILGLHVRTFDRAETAKDGVSLNLIRRESRLTRRRIHRRSHRLAMFRRFFHRLGAIDSPTSEAFMSSESPWQLRATGLDQLLESKQWVSALYHILKHRGFQSNRKSEVKSDEKAGQMLSGVTRNREMLTQSGLRTIGELIATHPEFTQAKRNKGGDYSHTVSRDDLVIELGLLFQCQRQFGNIYATDAVEDKVNELILNRQPTLSGERLLNMLGNCTFEPKEHRAPKASFSAEQFVWFTKLNNLRIIGDGESIGLTNEQRNLLIEMPFTQAKLTYKQVRKALSLSEDHKFNGLNYQTGDGAKDPEVASLFEAKAYHSIRKAYSGAGLDLEWDKDKSNEQTLNNIAYALSVFKDDAESRPWLLDRGISEPIIEAILDLSFSEFIRLSTKALNNILPHMRDGQRYDEAVISAGYKHHSHFKGGEKSKYLPQFEDDFTTNPVVARALNQARKLVNAIVKKYGSPTAVHIELARDLSRSFKDRQTITKDQGAYQQTKAGDITAFEELFGFTPKGVDLAKWRLYREQNGQCAYTQKPLAPYGDITQLFSPGQVEIDHALPYSRSFNNSMNNKVLVLTVENRNKANRTPFEYLNGGEESTSWRNFEAWVKSNKSYRIGKKNNLLRKNFGSDSAQEFRDRHLNDTRYICKAFKGFIEQHLQLSGEREVQRCVVVSGQLTAYLRARWGLLKVRENGDLHHALDAAVVAACSRSMVKRLSDYSRKGELEHTRTQLPDPETGEIVDIAALRKLEQQFPMPWPVFRDELKAKLSDNPHKPISEKLWLAHLLEDNVQPVRVSRAPTRRGLGAAHQETIRSSRFTDELKSHVKTPLSNISLKDLPNVVGYEDPRNHAMIDAIKKRLVEHDDKSDKAFATPLYKPGKDGGQGPLIRSVKLLGTQKSGIAIRQGIANNGEMVRTDVFTDGKKYFLVPVYVSDAAKKELPNRAVSAGKVESDWTVMDETYQFLFSLHKNDWICVQGKPKTKPFAGYYAGLDRATGGISLWSHDRNQAEGKQGLYRSIGVKGAENFTKYHIDLLGGLHKVQEETRQPLGQH